jgi:hypothetical protein
MTLLVIRGDHVSLVHVYWSCMGYRGFSSLFWSQWVIMCHWCMYIDLVWAIGATHESFSHNG